MSRDAQSNLSFQDRLSTIPGQISLEILQGAEIHSLCELLFQCYTTVLMKKHSLIFTLNLLIGNCGHCYCSVVCYYEEVFGSVIFLNCPSSSSRMHLKSPLVYSSPDWASPASSFYLYKSIACARPLSISYSFSIFLMNRGSQKCHRIPGVASPPPRLRG